MSEVDTSLLVDVLKRASARGATAADGFLIEEQSFSASVRLGQVDTVTHSREQRLALRVFSGRASAVPWLRAGADAGSVDMPHPAGLPAPAAKTASETRVRSASGTKTTNLNWPASS